MYYTERRRRKRWARYVWPLLLLAVYCGWSLARPLPALQAEKSPTLLRLDTSSGKLDWPEQGQAAVGIVGADTIQTHSAQKPVPIASTAKLITVLTVLEKKPLSPGQNGPNLTLTQKDVELYSKYLAQDGSVVPIQAGEKISQLKVIESILLPSANNMADSLAIWAFGSLAQYRLAADNYLQRHGLFSTKAGTDASGFSPSSTSTARDLVRLGELAMQNPLMAEVVSKATVNDIPHAGTIRNVNNLLGTDGIIGVKTGQTDQAGGVFVGAALATINQKPVTIVTAIVGAPQRDMALKETLPLVRSARTNVSTVTLLKADSIVGRYRLPWGGSVSAVTAKDFTLTAWNGASIKANLNLKHISPNAKKGHKSGSIRAAASPVNDQKAGNIVLSDSLPAPSAWWRLSHPWN